MTKLKLEDLIIKHYKYLFLEIYFSVRLIFMFGSRKSAKTKHVALRLVLRVMWDKNYNGLAMRKVAAELKDSVREELEWAINILGVSHLWKYKIQAREFIYLPYGNKILLKGISINPTSGKPSLSGLIVSQGWIKDVWLEEAWEFTKDDYKMIRQTIRGGTYTLIITGNPYFQGIWCVKMAMMLLMPILDLLKSKGQQWGYFEEQRENGKIKRLESIVHWNNFQINDKLSQADLDERWEEETSNPKDFIVTGYGFPGSPSGTILGDLVANIQFIEYEKALGLVKDFTCGIDIGLTRDATGLILEGWDTQENEYIFGEYYHSNGKQECNEYSNNGIWTRKEPFQIANDLLEMLITFQPLWNKGGDKLKISCDSADRAFIAILNQKARELKWDSLLKFIPTIGEDEGKREINSRIIAERHALSHKKVFIVTYDGKPCCPQLFYEMENIPWKITQNTGEARPERDGSKVHPDLTNSWEYARESKVDKQLKRIGVRI